MSQPALNIAVLGVGRIGSTVAFQLSEHLINTIGQGETAFGMSFFQANLKPDGRLEGKITGPGTQKTVLGDPRWADLFTSSGLPAEFEPNMGLWLRCHTPITIALETTMVKGYRRGSGISWGEAMDTANGIRDCFALIRKLGYEVYPQGRRRVDACPKWIVALGFWFLSKLRSLRELFVAGTPECDDCQSSMRWPSWQRRLGCTRTLSG